MHTPEDPGPIYKTYQQKSLQWRLQGYDPQGSSLVGTTTVSEVHQLPLPESGDPRSPVYFVSGEIQKVTGQFESGVVTLTLKDPTGILRVTCDLAAMGKCYNALSLLGRWDQCHVAGTPIWGPVTSLGAILVTPTVKALGPGYKVPCPDCGADMVLLESKVYSRAFWSCRDYPECRGAHSADAGGTPIGTPADEATRYLRSQAHKVFDPLWETGELSKAEAYLWLGEKMGLTEEQCHIRYFDRDQCRKVIDLCWQRGGAGVEDLVSGFLQGPRL